MNRPITIRCLCCIFAVGFAFAACSQVSADDAELRKRIQVLERQAAELREAGRRDEFAKVIEQIKDLTGELRAGGADRRESSNRPRERYIEQIFAAVDALRELGRPEDARRLLEIGRKLRKEAHGSNQPDREQKRKHEEAEHRERDAEHRERESEKKEREHPEIRAAREQAAVLRIAMAALAKADRSKGANQLEHAIRALELGIEGRRDEEAKKIRQSAPNRNNQAEWLMLAHRILKEKDQNEKANVVLQLAERLARRRQATNQPANAEREVALRQLELMRVALGSLREARREDSIEILMGAIRAREVTLEGRRDDEAHQIREKAPSQEHVIKTLLLSAELWQEFKQPEKAESIVELAQEFKQRLVRRRDNRTESPSNRLQEVQARIQKLSAELEELREHVKRLER